MSNFAPCQGQVTSWPSISPSHKGPSSCVQALSRAKNSPSILNRTISLPLRTTSRDWPGAISLVLAAFTNSAMQVSSRGLSASRPAEREHRRTNNITAEALEVDRAFGDSERRLFYHFVEGRVGVADARQILRRRSEERR